MNYLKVPDSDVKLIEGSVVMLARFPGTKWVVHNGWYNYGGRRCMGWYFSSIPARTIIPANDSDLQLITVLSETSDVKPYKRPPEPPIPDTPGGWAPPADLPPAPGRPPIPSPIFPPVAPPPEPTKLVDFDEDRDTTLNRTFISVPTIKVRDAIPHEKLADGRLIRVNSVDGVPKYYRWSEYNDRFEPEFDDVYTKAEIDQKLAAMQQEEDAQDELDLNSLNKKIDDTAAALRSEAEGTIGALSARVDEVKAELAANDDSIREESRNADNAIRSEINELSENVDQVESTIYGKINDLKASAEATFADHDERITKLREDGEWLAGEVDTLKSNLDADVTDLAAFKASMAEQLEALSERIRKAGIRIGNLETERTKMAAQINEIQQHLVEVEQSVYNIAQIAAQQNNTVLVSSKGTLKDSGYALGDDSIDETSDDASDKTLATEKAVAKAVENSVPKWDNFG